MPDEVAVLGETAPTAFRMEIVLIPVGRFGGGGCRLHRPRDILDVVGIAGDQCHNSIRPKGGDNATATSAPVIAADHRAVDVERIHQRQ